MPDGQGIRGFFGDEMPGRDGSAAHLAGPGFPYLQRLVPAGDRAGFTPEDQRGAGDQTASAVGLVVLVIECGGGTVRAVPVALTAKPVAETRQASNRAG